MGRWEKKNDPLNSIYKQTVKEGFILTQGHLQLSFDDNPFNGDINFPSFQLLMVHRNHPFKISYGGRVSVRPLGDKRLQGDILRDKNPNVYDAVSFFFLHHIKFNCLKIMQERFLRLLMDL